MPAPTSRSAYRGLSRTGMGEGPEQPIQHGEQFMRVDKELYDAGLLDAMRPWMTLDSDPLDHERLNDCLEGWSLFSLRDYLFVVRLVSAGIYDRRAAYFSHARVWRRSTLPRTFDPGLNLGRARAFAEPWRDQEPVPSENFENESSIVRPEQIKREAETAALFLGHLFQTLVQQTALIITAPVTDFQSGSSLHALVSFARGGLPAEYRDECRVRIYSRQPDQFLRPLRATLTVIPEQTAPAAVASKPGATLLDRRGNKVMGRDLDPRFLDYAKWVVERAVALPEGLAQFSERYAFKPHEFARGESTRASVQITYNVAFVLAEQNDSRAKLLSEYLPLAATMFGPGLEWKRFIRDVEWGAFPRTILLDHLLSDRSALSAGGQELLDTIEDSASRLNLVADERLDGWWVAGDPAKQRRLVELLTHSPPLVSSSAVAERTVTVSLDRLAGYGSLDRVLRAETESDWIRERRQSAELATHASDRAVFDVLRYAVSVGRLDTEWAQVFVKRASALDIASAAETWLADPHFWKKWGSVPRLLLDRLRSLQPVPLSLRALIANGCGLAPAADLRIYLRLADLLTRIDEAERRNPDSRLIGSLLASVGQLDEDQRAFIESVVFDSEWRCLRLETLELSHLLQIASLLRKEESFALLCAELDQRVRHEPEATTAALARTGWWYFWRCHSQLSANNQDDAESLQRGALAWLGSARGDVALEAWDLAVQDLPRQFAGRDLAHLREQSSDGIPWPVIAPFEQRQVEALAQRAADLGALAEIAEAVNGDAFAVPVYEHVLSQSALAGDLPASALAWLLATPNRQTLQRPELTLRESMLLCERAGHRMTQAIAARVQSVAEALNTTPAEALHAAARPQLWKNGQFLSRLATWINDKGSVSAIGKEALSLIEEKIGDGEADSRPEVRQGLTDALVQQGWRKVAKLLDPKRTEDVERDVLATRVIDALLNKRANDPCWQKLADSIRKAQSQRTLPAAEHPLRHLAERIADRILTPDQRNALANAGWETLEKITRHQKVLTAPSPDGGLPLFDVAASMLGPGAIGLAAMRVRNLADPSNRQEVAWWRRLLASVHGFRRYGRIRCGDDREGLALTYLLSSLATIPNEYRALTLAMKIEAKNDTQRALLFELGVEPL